MQALIMTFLSTVLIQGLNYGFRDAILSCLVTMHQAPGASCGILYYPGLVSCPFYVIPTIIIPFLIYKMFHLLVIFVVIIMTI